VTGWPGASWLNVNDAYSYATALYRFELTADQHAPVMPYLLIESTYENERGATTQLLHAEASVVAGRATAWWLDPATGATTAVGSLPEALTDPASAVVAGALWLFGGEHGNPVDTVLRIG